MHRFPLDFTTVLVHFTLSWAAATYPTAPTEPPVGPCATVRCGFNTQCFEFNGMARCYNTTCPPGEVFSECSSYCEPTCIPQNIACIQSCGPPACQCQPGFLRDNGKCVDPSRCSNIKSSTSTYVDEPITPPITTCAQAPIQINCITGYHCEIVNGMPRCLPDPVDEPITPPLTTCDQAPIQINCITGYHCEIVNGMPRCLPDPACGANEEFKQCASCEPTCGPIVPCLDVCFPPACQCVGGYVRDNGKCIRRTDCKDSYVGG